MPNTSEMDINNSKKHFSFNPAQLLCNPCK